MKTEKVVLSFIAVVIGLLVAGIAFFLYQSTKTIPDSKIPKITIANPTPTKSPSVFLSIDKPQDGEVVSQKSITISGKTIEGATLIVSTSGTDQVVSPAENGNYSVSVPLDDDENQITLTAISQSGDEITKTITVTYSTEDF